MYSWIGRPVRTHTKSTCRETERATTDLNIRMKSSRGDASTGGAQKTYFLVFGAIKGPRSSFWQTYLWNTFKRLQSGLKWLYCGSFWEDFFPGDSCWDIFWCESAGWKSRTALIEKLDGQVTVKTLWCCKARLTASRCELLRGSLKWPSLELNYVWRPTSLIWTHTVDMEGFNHLWNTSRAFRVDWNGHSWGHLGRCLSFKRLIFKAEVGMNRQGIEICSTVFQSPKIFDWCVSK